MNNLTSAPQNPSGRPARESSGSAYRSFPDDMLHQELVLLARKVDALMFAQSAAGRALYGEFSKRLREALAEYEKRRGI